MDSVVVYFDETICRLRLILFHRQEDVEALDDDSDTGVNDVKGFAKADDSVLANRKIVKAR